MFADSLVRMFLDGTLFEESIICQTCTFLIPFKKMLYSLHIVKHSLPITHHQPTYQNLLCSELWNLLNAKYRMISVYL